MKDVTLGQSAVSNGPMLYTIVDLETRLQVSRRKLADYVKRGVLRSTKIGASLRFTPEAVADFIAQHGTQPDGSREPAMT